MEEGRRAMEGILSKKRKEEKPQRQLSFVEAYRKKVMVSKRMAKRLDRTMGKSYAVILRALEEQAREGRRIKK